jgi:hypothetical protein
VKAGKADRTAESGDRRCADLCLLRQLLQVQRRKLLPA